MDTENKRKGSCRINFSAVLLVLHFLYAFNDFCFALLQEGRTIVETRTADIISETRKLHIRRKGSGPDDQNQDTNGSSPWRPSQNQADQETQLKASRDVRWQMCITGS